MKWLGNDPFETGTEVEVFLFDLLSVVVVFAFDRAIFSFTFESEALSSDLGAIPALVVTTVVEVEEVTAAVVGITVLLVTIAALVVVVAIVVVVEVLVVVVVSETRLNTRFCNNRYGIR